MLFHIQHWVHGQCHRAGSILHDKTIQSSGCRYATMFSSQMHNGANIVKGNGMFPVEAYRKTR